MVSAMTFIMYTKINIDVENSKGSNYSDTTYLIPANVFIQR